MPCPSLKYAKCWKPFSFFPCKIVMPILSPGWESKSLLSVPGKNLCKASGSLPVTSHLLQKIMKDKKENEVEKFRDVLLYQQYSHFILLTACLTCVQLHSAHARLYAPRPAHLLWLKGPTQSHLPPKLKLEWFWRRYLGNADQWDCCSFDFIEAFTASGCSKSPQRPFYSEDKHDLMNNVFVYV